MNFFRYYGLFVLITGVHSLLGLFHVIHSGDLVFTLDTYDSLYSIHNAAPYIDSHTSAYIPIITRILPSVLDTAMLTGRLRLFGLSTIWLVNVALLLVFFVSVTKKLYGDRYRGIPVAVVASYLLIEYLLSHVQIGHGAAIAKLFDPTDWTLLSGTFLLCAMFAITHCSMRLEENPIDVKSWGILILGLTQAWMLLPPIAAFLISLYVTVRIIALSLRSSSYGASMGAVLLFASAMLAIFHVGQATPSTHETIYSDLGLGIFDVVSAALFAIFPIVLVIGPKNSYSPSRLRFLTVAFIPALPLPLIDLNTFYLVVIVAYAYGLLLDPVMRTLVPSKHQEVVYWFSVAISTVITLLTFENSIEKMKNPNLEKRPYTLLRAVQRLDQLDSSLSVPLLSGADVTSFAQIYSERPTRPVSLFGGIKNEIPRDLKNAFIVVHKGQLTKAHLSDPEFVYHTLIYRLFKLRGEGSTLKTLSIKPISGITWLEEYGEGSKFHTQIFRLNRNKAINDEPAATP